MLSLTSMNSRRPSRHCVPSPPPNNIKISSQWVSSLSFCYFGKFCLGQMHSTGTGIVIFISPHPLPPPAPYLGGFCRPTNRSQHDINDSFKMRSTVSFMAWYERLTIMLTNQWQSQLREMMNVRNISCYQSGRILKLILYSSKLTVRLVLF